MKKLLIGTTALVAGGLIAGSVMAAEIDVAAPEVIDDGFTVTWNGYIRSGFYVGSDDCTEPDGVANCVVAGPLTAANGGTNPDANETTVPLTAELQLFAEQTLANGLRVGGEIDFDIDNGTGSNVQIDEVWLFIDGTFGQIRLGQKEGALDSIGGSGKPGWGAFNGGTDGPDMGMTSQGAFAGGMAVATGANGLGAAIGSDGSMEDISGDANKITYLSPEFAGINFAVSFTPDPQSQRANGRSLAINGDNERWLNEWSVAANITKTYGEHTFRVAGGFTSAEAEKNNTGLGDVDIWKIGGSVKSSYGGVGGWYSNRSYDLVTSPAGVISTPNLRITETTSWGFMGNIIKGDYTFGGGYTRVEDQIYSTAGINNTDNELDIWGFGVSKKLGTGVEMGINATIEDYSGTYDSNTATRGHEADGWLAGWYAAIAF